MAICVLTGDIVGSTTLTNAQLMRIQTILQTTDQLLRERGETSRIDLHRGDGWQTAFSTPQMSLRFALCFRAALRSEHENFTTRIAIACGREILETKPIETARTATFVASGTSLETISNDSLMVHAAGGALQAATVLADHVSRNWTPAQAKAIEAFLHPFGKPTQTEIASILGISRQAVGQALDAAGYPAIKAALTAIEKQAK